MRALIQKSQQLGPYNINCEARLALGELEMELNFPRAALNSSPWQRRFAVGALELVARQAEQAITRPNVVVAANKRHSSFSTDLKARPWWRQLSEA